MGPKGGMSCSCRLIVFCKLEITVEICIMESEPFNSTSHSVIPPGLACESSEQIAKMDVETLVPPQRTQELSCPNVYCRIQVQGLGSELTSRQAEGVVKAAMKQMYGTIGGKLEFGLIDVAAGGSSSSSCAFVVRMSKG